jgi:hypothetical protein
MYGPRWWGDDLQVASVWVLNNEPTNATHSPTYAPTQGGVNLSNTVVGVIFALGVMVVLGCSLLAFTYSRMPYVPHALDDDEDEEKSNRQGDKGQVDLPKSFLQSPSNSLPRRNTDSDPRDLVKISPDEIELLQRHSSDKRRIDSPTGIKTTSRRVAGHVGAIQAYSCIILSFLALFLLTLDF